MKNNEEKIITFGLAKICVASDFNIVDDINIPSPCVVSQAVRVHLQNSRQGTVACKSRAELVSRSNKKPWKQKGTGKARAGSPRSPLWRGGGVCFGPQARTRVLYINKKMNKNSMKYLFLDLLDAQKVVSIDFTFDIRSTKKAYELLKLNNLHDKKIVFLYDVLDVDTYYSFANLNLVQLVSFDAIHSYILANDNYFVYLNKDDNRLKDVVNAWLV
ncbi:MAG: Ribosomal protein [Bacteroidota bacterium]|jgi:large subunit ribosomal protein L4